MFASNFVVLILGGGFAGAIAAKKLVQTNYFQVTMVDANGYYDVSQK